MSNLNPIQLERYVIYLDNLILIRIDKNPDFYELLYRDGEVLRLARSFRDSLNSLLPSGFIPYTEMWVNDLFIHYMNKTWDNNKQSYVLITRLVNFGEIKEYGTSENLDLLISQRMTRSIGSVVNTQSEINQSIATQVTPVVTQVVQDTVTPIVNQTVNTAIQQNLSIDNLDAYYNAHLNAEG